MVSVVGVLEVDRWDIAAVLVEAAVRRWGVGRGINVGDPQRDLPLLHKVNRPGESGDFLV